MFVRGRAPYIAIGQQDADMLHTIIPRPHNFKLGEVDAFLASELRRADRFRGVYSMFEHVTLESWVLYRLASGRIQFAKVTLKSTDPFTASSVPVTSPIGAALIGLRQDQSIEWRMHDGTIESLTVLMILPPTRWWKLRPMLASLGDA
jgi:regulator of nucleoside diphosphate kinase